MQRTEEEQAKHTPGPWKIRELRDFGIDRAVDIVARIGDQPWESSFVYVSTNGAVHQDQAELLPNAHLISAAPDMLEALLSIQDVCANEKGLSVSGAVLDQIEGYLHAAIAKATGAQS